MGGKRIKWTDEKIQFIIDKYTSQEMNTTELAKYFGCSNDTISRRLKEQNINPHKFYEDLTGKTFGRLTVLNKSDKSNRRLYWDCECECGKKITIKGDVLRQKRQISCGCQQSKGEVIIEELLKQNNILFVSQYYFDDLVSEYNNIPYRFDFGVIVNNLLTYLIEFDGEQHFYYQKNNTSSWNTEEKFIKTQIRDNKKNNYCIEHNIPLIRIPYYIKDTITIEDLQLETSKYIINNRKE